MHSIKSIAHELRFWSSFVKSQRFLRGWLPNMKTPELHDEAYKFIKKVLTPDSKVLDVGSGVVSILNGTVPKHNLLACDPLGELYECIFNYKFYKISPPISVDGEEMKFESMFDIVHISNALDHTEDPRKVINNMITALKPGGYLIIQSFENESDHQNGEGMHKTNLAVKGENLLINNEVFEFENTKYISSFIEEKRFENRDWFIYIRQKEM